MIRGTTPTNIFNVDVDLTTATAIFITYNQNGKTVFEKSLADGEITVAADKLTVVLTQQETLKLDDRDIAIQIRAKMPDSTVLASNIINATVDEVLKDEVI